MTTPTTTNMSANFPQFNEAPIRIDPQSGVVTWSPTWYRFLINMFQRTGGSSGQNTNVGPQGPMGPIGPIGPTNSDSDESDSFMMIPGPVGMQGVPGMQGPMWPSDFDTGNEDSMMMLPGPVGPQGAPGPPGPVAPHSFDNDDSDSMMLMPGPIGPQGATGSTGSQGATGPQGPVLALGFDPDEQGNVMMIPGPAGPSGQQGVSGIGSSLMNDTDAVDIASEALSFIQPIAGSSPYFNNVRLTGNVNSTTSTTGTLIVTGGIGVSGNITGAASISGATLSASTAIGINQSPGYNIDNTSAVFIAARYSAATATNGVCQIYTNTGGSLSIGIDSSLGANYGYAYGGFFWHPGAYPLVFGTNNIARLLIDSSGNVTVITAAGLGYGTGSGGTVTQATSRTTGVTLNKPCGAITLFSAAGSVTPATFTVTNSIVAATDVVQVCQKSGTNLYEIFVTAVASGSFNITFLTTGGIASDAPVFNFVVIKAATS